jgi:hypothetical protein
MPLRSYNQETGVVGEKEERTVCTLPKFTIANDKHLIIKLMKNYGGRNQTLVVENEDIIAENNKLFHISRFFYYLF